MKILIIEDEKLLAVSLKMLLERKGFEVECVYDGKTGSEYALLGIYDLLILDVMMPGMDGYQVAREVRSKRCDTPILMDNASKYASPGGETIVKLQKNAHRKCLLTVSNQGEPIDPDDLRHLFERFYRADKARTMNHSYGLGLSIAQNIAEEHHGKIWATSEEGYNHFFVEIPYESAR